MQRRRVYSTGCMISHSPGYRTQEPEFYRCGICGAVQVRIRSAGIRQPPEKKEQSMEGTGQPAEGTRQSMEEPQKHGPETTGTCCGKRLEQLVPCTDQPVCEEHKIGYCIFGGFEHNTIRVEVDEGHHPMSEEHRIEWIYLRTFQGGQMKYLGVKGESATLFAMANEDAYAFCGREVCHMGWEHCLFQCKRGHVAYAYCSKHGLFRYVF